MFTPRRAQAKKKNHWTSSREDPTLSIGHESQLCLLTAAGAHATSVF